jgi:hypothetical protein
MTDLNRTRLQELAESLDCLTEADLLLLAGITPSTAEAWRKRRIGPDYILLGNNYLYPRKNVAVHLEKLTRVTPSLAKDML